MSDPARALSAVLGRGSAHEGAHHWRAQRLTAVALLLLGPWFAISMARLPDFSYGSVHGFLSGLCNSALLCLLAACLCWHSQLGVQVVIEDYVKGALRMAALIVSAFLHVLLAVLAVLAVLRVAFTAH
ncbi:MAG TPA: succinate dehydrogenase, hydrophobic membrane anchor protein [Steroidobacteraceae bacterium]|nr:succinate dehydrogenase, hydrophobic membrane anchor protein [Steroidobacteraceae bacterium]